MGRSNPDLKIDYSGSRSHLEVVSNQISSVNHLTQGPQEANEDTPRNAKPLSPHNGASPAPGLKYWLHGIHVAFYSCFKSEVQYQQPQAGSR